MADGVWRIGGIPRDHLARLDWLDELLVRWRRPRGPADGIAEGELLATEQRPGFVLPPILKEIYRRLGRANDLVRAQNELLRLEELAVRDSHLVVWRENQSVVHWAVPMADIGADDPPVDIDVSGLRPGFTPHPIWEREDPSLSAMTLRMVTFESTLLAPFAANGVSQPEAVTWVVDGFREMPFAPWKWPAEPDSRIYERDDMLVALDGDTWLWLGSCEERSYHEVVSRLEALGMTWEDRA